MDIDAILLEIRRALEQMEPTGHAGGLFFYNTRDADTQALRAELHLFDGKIARFQIVDTETCGRVKTQDDPDLESTKRMIATLRAGAKPR